MILILISEPGLRYFKIFQVVVIFFPAFVIYSQSYINFDRRMWSELFLLFGIYCSLIYSQFLWHKYVLFNFIVLFVVNLFILWVRQVLRIELKLFIILGVYGNFSYFQKILHYICKYYSVLRYLKNVLEN